MELKYKCPKCKRKDVYKRGRGIYRCAECNISFKVPTSLDYMKKDLFTKK